MPNVTGHWPVRVAKERGVDGQAQGSRIAGGGCRGALHGGRGAARAGRRGARAGLSDLRGDRRLPRGGRGHQGAGPGPACPPDRDRHRGGRRRGTHGWTSRRAVGAAGADRRRSAGVQEGRDRPDGRAEPRLAAALPALDRPGGPAHGRPGGLPRQAHRARRHVRQAADDRGQPAPRRLDREGLPRSRAVVPRPDPGGLAGLDPRGREVRLPPRLQVLDVRHLVDSPGRDARDRRQGAHDPDPGAHGREAQQGRARRASARAGVRSRALAGGDRARAAVDGARGQGHPAHRAAAGLAREADRRGGGLRARRLRRGRGRRRRRSSRPARTCGARTCAGRSTPCPRASAR